MANKDPKDKEILETPKSPNVVYVVDGHGDGWYCTEETEDEEALSGECVQEEDVEYNRSFGG